MDEEVELHEEFDATEESVDLHLSANDFSGLVISPTDWTIGSLHAQIGKQIELNPDFQRRNVWSQSAKARFIESILLGIPIPQILLSSKEGQKNSFLVLDGKQRLLALRDFLENSFPLRGLRVLRELEGKFWNEIADEAKWRDGLLNETQRTAVIRNWRDERVLYEIFYRVNSASVKLSPMELRMSLHPGPFLKFIVAWTEAVGPLHALLGRKNPDPRMADVELSIRFLAFDSREQEYRGDLKAFLDEACVSFNARFTEDSFEQSLNASLARMNAAIDAGLRIFPARRFCRKFGASGYESRFNRAVFDVQVGALSHEEVRKAALSDYERFARIFEEVSLDPRFLRAVEATTKTPEATRNRFSVFYDAINVVYGTNILVPRVRIPQ